MINRRHIRIKVMQSVYAMLTAHTDDLVKEEKFLNHSIAKLQELYVLQLQVILAVQQLAAAKIQLSKKKHLATEEDLNPNTKFVDNPVLKSLANSQSLSTFIADKKLDNWQLDDEYVKLIWKDLETTDLYKEYLKSDDNSFKNDKQFVLRFFKQYIAPNDKLADYYEDKNISWLDDIPFVNTWILRTVEKIKPTKSFVLDNLYKDHDDKQFVLELFRKVMLHHHTFEKNIAEKTPNWELERIADIDMILIKMALCEFLYFPTIPVRVTINEYIEIAKDYSTDKSSYFINGLLDKLSKEYLKTNQMQKIGRGLL